MKTNFSTLLAGSLALFFFSGTAIAGDHEKMIVALKTNDFEVAETDISELAVGEAKTILTDSGKTIDILRTENGADIYVDGELMEMPAMDGAHDQEIHRNVEIECIIDSGDAEGAETECDHDMSLISDEDIDIEAGDGTHKIVRIHKSHDGDENTHATKEKIIIIKKKSEEDL